MKLYYYESPNFGDALNPWIWPRLLPGFFDEYDNTVFVGIGTLLNSRVPQSPQKIVFGSGVGYGKGLPVVDSKWKIYCVRGPLSAKALGLPAELAVTDAALLVRTLTLPKERQIYPLAYMPHIDSTRYWDWDTVCKNIGLHFIDPRRSVDDVLQEIQRTQLLITEAMHGAIVADALRIPWVPVRAYKRILTLKWQDWCNSVSLEYRPVELPSLYHMEVIVDRWNRRLASGLEKRKFAGAKKYLSPLVDLGIRSGMWLPNKLALHRVTDQLAKVMKNPLPYLSSDSTVMSLTSRLEERLQQVQLDYQSRT